MESEDLFTNTDYPKYYDLAWFSKVLGVKVNSIKWDDFDSDGVVSNLTKVDVVIESTNGDGTTKERLVLKRYTGNSKVDVSLFQMAGLTREADFYNYVEANADEQQRQCMTEERRSILRELVPKVYFARSDAARGRKVILMQDVSVGGFPPLYIYLRHPFNVGKEQTISAARSRVDFDQGFAYRLVEDVFAAAAKLHAAFWKDDNPAALPWARGIDWLRNQGQERWMALLTSLEIGEELYGRDKDLSIFDHSDIPVGKGCLNLSFRGRSPVEWRDFPSVRLSVCPFVHPSPPLGQPASQVSGGRTDGWTDRKSPYSTGLLSLINVPIHPGCRYVIMNYCQPG